MDAKVHYFFIISRWHKIKAVFQTMFSEDIQLMSSQSCCEKDRFYINMFRFDNKQDVGRTIP